MTDAVNAPSTAQLLAALASGLLPLAGPGGIAVAALVPAVEQLLDNLTSTKTANYTVDSLVQIITQDNAAALAKLNADVNAMP